MPYSLDLKEKVITYLDNGGKVYSAAKIFGINRASIYRQQGFHPEFPTVPLIHRHNFP